jgi:hypothetical protein
MSMICMLIYWVYSLYLLVNHIEHLLSCEEFLKLHPCYSWKLYKLFSPVSTRCHWLYVILLLKVTQLHKTFFPVFTKCPIFLGWNSSSIISLFFHIEMWQNEQQNHSLSIYIISVSQFTLNNMSWKR